MYPLFSRSRSKGSSGGQRLQEKSSPRGTSDNTMTPPGSSRTPPSESQQWAHVGVLANDVEHAQEVAPQKW